MPQLLIVSIFLAESVSNQLKAHHNTSTKKKNIFLLWTSIKLHSKLTHESHEEQNPCSKPCTPNPKPSPRLHPLLRFSHRIPRSVANDNQLDTFVF